MQPGVQPGVQPSLGVQPSKDLQTGEITFGGASSAVHCTGGTLPNAKVSLCCVVLDTRSATGTGGAGGHWAHYSTQGTLHTADLTL